MSKEIYRNMELYFPFLAKHAVEYIENGPFELIIKLDDGNIVSYDDMNKTMRTLPRDSSKLSEEECRREFSMRLKKLMAFKRVTQAELSNRTGISQPTICRYLNGVNMPSFYVVDKIAKALGCSTEEFRYIF